MSKNVGRTDAMIRIAGGLLGLAYGIGRMGRRPYRTPWLLMGFSAMKVAEGMTRFCPIYAALGISTDSRKERKQLLDKLRNMGMQAAEMTKVTAGGKEKRKQEHAVSQHAEPDSHPSAQAEKSGSQGMTSEDKRIESAVREFVAAEMSETNNPSDTYRRDEHLYPTYS